MFNALEAILICLVMQAALTDLSIRKIPNVLVLSGLILALVLHLLAGPAWSPLTAWLAGAAAGFFLFLPLYLLRGMAAGDVKLMAMVGAFVGPLAALEIGLLTFLAGGLLALLMLVASGRFGACWRNVRAMLKPLLWRLAGVPLLPVPLPKGDSVGGMPYAVAIAAATTLFVAWTPSGLCF